MSKRKARTELRSWVSEKEATQQLLWTYICASLAIALTVLSRFI